MHRLVKTRLVGDAHDASRVSTRHLNLNDSGKDSRGRSFVPLSLEEKQVRCVSLSLFPILLRGQRGAVNMTIMPPMQTEVKTKKNPQNPHQIRPDSQERLFSLRVPRPTCPAHEGAQVTRQGQVGWTVSRTGDRRGHGSTRGCKGHLAPTTRP